MHSGAVYTSTAAKTCLSIMGCIYSMHFGAVQQDQAAFNGSSSMLHLFDALWCRTHVDRTALSMEIITLHLFDALRYRTHSLHYNLLDHNVYGMVCARSPRRVFDLTVWLDISPSSLL